MAYYVGIYAGKHVVFIILLLILAKYLVQLTLNTPIVGFLTFYMQYLELKIIFLNVNFCQTFSFIGKLDVNCSGRRFLVCLKDKSSLVNSPNRFTDEK